SEDLAEGLSKATTLALRFGLAYTTHAKDYDIVDSALELPEVKDSIATLWDCVDLPKSNKMWRGAAAVGHIGDTVLRSAMKLYQTVGRAAEMRTQREEMERKKASGVQSVFDLSGNNHHGNSSSAGHVQSGGFESASVAAGAGTVQII